MGLRIFLWTSALHRRTSEDCDKIPEQDCSTLFYAQLFQQSRPANSLDQKVSVFMAID